ncbi:MAG: hypothetical protein HZC54_03950 [Verrucomicrobia bacterium]|nr:hypothetical protein [Verrucomicrobiota bacterium]
MKTRLNCLIGLILAGLCVCGCSRTALVGRAGPAADGRKSVVCFTLRTDYTSLDRRPITGPLDIVVTNEADRKRTSVPLSSRPGVQGAIEKCTPDNSVFTQLILLELPAGEYALEEVALPNTFRWTELVGQKKMVFTVRDSQVTYAGEVVLKLETVRKEVMAETFTWTLAHNDTAARDEKWAKKSFQWLEKMPSGVVPFYSKPASSPLVAVRDAGRNDATRP